MFKRRDSVLCSAFANSTLGDLSPTSIGATASVPIAKANRVSWLQTCVYFCTPIVPGGGILPIFPLGIPS